MKALKVAAIAALVAAFASFTAAVWAAADLQGRLSAQGFLLVVTAMILGFVVWAP